MITDKGVAFLKEKYYGHKLIYVRFSNMEFIFRTLSKKEYKYIKENSDSIYDTQDMICNLACVYPNDYDFEECPIAGIPEKASRIIENESGFTNIKKILDCYYEAKENITLEQQCMDLIKAFIPEYTYEEMEDWTWKRLMETTARAERVASLKGYKDFKLNDISEDVEKEYDEMSSDNKEFVEKLYKNGIDPMFYFKDELRFKNELIELPFIMGTSYDEEVILNAVREQITKKNIRNS